MLLCFAHFRLPLMNLRQCLLICVLIVIGTTRCATADNALPDTHSIASTIFTLEERRSMNWLPPQKFTEKLVFHYLAAKCGGDVATPVYPGDANGLTQWLSDRQTALIDAQHPYPLIYGNLLVAYALLDEPAIERKRMGILIARQTELYILFDVKDWWLSARLCEAFLLPHMDIAHTLNGMEVSRREILEDSYASYDANAETINEVATLQFLLHFADSVNTADWARIKLAQTLAQQKKYRQAITYLQALQHPDQQWIAQLQQEQKASQQEQQPLGKRNSQ